MQAMHVFNAWVCHVIVNLWPPADVLMIFIACHEYCPMAFAMHLLDYCFIVSLKEIVHDVMLRVKA